MWQECNEKGSDLLQPRLVAKYSDNVKETLHKAIVLDLMESDEVELTTQEAYAEFMTLTSARFLLTQAFIEDARTITAALSLLCQRACLLACDINLKHDAVQAQLRALGHKPGYNESTIRQQYCAVTQTFQGLAIPNWEEDSKLFLRDRTKYLMNLCNALAEKIPLTEGVHGWISVIMNRKDWPLDCSEPVEGEPEAQEHPMDAYGTHEMGELLSHYKKFMTDKWPLLSFETIAQNVQTEWSTWKALVLRDHKTLKAGGLHTLKVHHLWQRLVTTFDDRLTFLTFLIKICLKVPYDTSCCERWFSLMNRLKSKYRNRMSQILIQNLMFICAHGPKKLVDLDVPAAIGMWRNNSKRGRYMGKWMQDMQPVIEDMEREFKAVQLN